MSKVNSTSASSSEQEQKIMWDGLFDVSSTLEPVWFSRPSLPTSSDNSGSTNIGTTTGNSGTVQRPGNLKKPVEGISSKTTNVLWKPFKKVDCVLLNQRLQIYRNAQDQCQNIESSDTSKDSVGGRFSSHIVYIDSGRYTVNLQNMTMMSTYRNRHTLPSISEHFEYDICYTTWFMRSNTEIVAQSSSSSNNSDELPQIEFVDGTVVQSSFILEPVIDQNDVQKIELFYQMIQQGMNEFINNKDITISQSLLEYVQEQIQMMESFYIDNDTYVLQCLQPKNKNTMSLQKAPYTKDNDTSLNNNGNQNWLASVLTSMSNQISQPPAPKPYVLQRGYTPYSVPNEDIEAQLGPVQHIVFVVHGIGEAYFHRSDTSIVGLIEQVAALQTSIQMKQHTNYQKKLLKHQQKYKQSKEEQIPPAPLPPNRIEFIPIEWYHCVRTTNANNNGQQQHPFISQLQLITIPSIPALRSIANDVLLDVLLYVTPSFCYTVLQTVIQQISSIYNTYTQLVNPNFIEQNGTITIMGHSLGSVITWDILSLLKQHQLLSISSESKNNSVKKEIVSSEPISSSFSSSSYGPSLLQPMDICIPFVPNYTIFLGSPIGLFLTLRNAYAAFQQECGALMHNMSSHDTSDYDPYYTLSNGTIINISPFSLPTNSLYNIYHPSDPVAYRIEPLLLSVIPDIDAESNQSITPQYHYDIILSKIPPPLYLTVPGEDVRFHVKAKQLSDMVRKSLFSNNDVVRGSQNNNKAPSVSKKVQSHPVSSNENTSNSSSSSLPGWASLVESAVSAAVATNNISSQPNHMNPTITNRSGAGWSSLFESAVSAAVASHDANSNTQQMTTNPNRGEISAKTNVHGSTTDVSTTIATNSQLPPKTTKTSYRSNDVTTTKANIKKNQNEIQFPLAGKNNPNRRVDFCLQPLLVDNEYISAVTAHSSYLTNADIQDFIAGILTTSSAPTSN